MTQEQTKSEAQQIIELSEYRNNSDSMNRELKAINDGLTQRCTILAADRDNHARDANTLRVHIQNMAETENKLRAEVADLTKKLFPETEAASDDKPAI